jgi:hypothetical protein
MYNEKCEHDRKKDKPKNPAKREEVKMLNCRNDIIPSIVGSPL